MENAELIKMVVELVVCIVAFAVGRYVLPKYKEDIQHAVAQFEVILKYAESFCAYARQFLTDYSGSQKMDAVVEKLKAICAEKGIDVDEETLRAIAQKAYDAMIAGESSSKLIIESAVTELQDAKTYEEKEEETTTSVEEDPFEDDTK